MSNLNFIIIVKIFIVHFKENIRCDISVIMTSIEILLNSERKGPHLDDNNFEFLKTVL